MEKDLQIKKKGSERQKLPITKHQLLKQFRYNSTRFSSFDMNLNLIFIC